jgi:hypothetical protein
MVEGGEVVLMWLWGRWRGIFGWRSRGLMGRRLGINLIGGVSGRLELCQIQVYNTIFTGVI